HFLFSPFTQSSPSRHQNRAVFRSKRLISSSSAESSFTVKTAGSCQRVEKAGRCLSISVAHPTPWRLKRPGIRSVFESELATGRVRSIGGPDGPFRGARGLLSFLP